MSPCIASTFGERARRSSLTDILSGDWGLEEYQTVPHVDAIKPGILLDSDGFPRRIRNQFLNPASKEETVESEPSEEPLGATEDSDQILLRRMQGAVLVLEVVEIDADGDEIDKTVESNAVSIGFGLFLCCARAFIGRDPESPSLRYLARLRKPEEEQEVCQVAVSEYGCVYQNINRLLPHEHPISPDDDWAILKVIPGSSISISTDLLLPRAHPGLTTYEPLKMAGHNVRIENIVGHLKKYYSENLRFRLPLMKAAVRDLHPGELSITDGTGIRGTRVPMDDGFNTFRFSIDVSGHFVQYDMSCTPGTSGSAILDDEGQWIGIHQGCLTEYIDGRKQVTKKTLNQGILLSHPHLKNAVIRQLNQLKFNGDQSTSSISNKERDDIVTSWINLRTKL